MNSIIHPELHGYENLTVEQLRYALIQRDVQLRAALLAVKRSMGMVRTLLKKDVDETRGHGG